MIGVTPRSPALQGVSYALRVKERRMSLEGESSHLRGKQKGQNSVSLSQKSDQSGTSHHTTQTSLHEISTQNKRSPRASHAFSATYMVFLLKTHI